MFKTYCDTPAEKNWDKLVEMQWFTAVWEVLTLSLVLTTFCTRSNKFNLVDYSCFSLEPYKFGSGHETRCSP